jgi:hypothetical protein
MMSMTKANWPSYGYSVISTLFITFCILSIVESKFCIRFSQFSMERSKLGLISIAPENLAGAPESFWYKLRVEAPDVAAEEMTKTKAWSRLQEQVSAYAQRLELMERQSEDIEEHFMRLSTWTSWLTLALAVGMAALAILMNRKGREDGGGSSRGQPLTGCCPK